MLLTNSLTNNKELIINYYNKIYENSGINYFWSVQFILDVLDKLRIYDGTFNTVDSFEFSTLYTTRPHTLINHKFSYLIKWSFGYLFEV